MEQQTVVTGEAVVKKDSQWVIWWRQMRPHTLTASFVPVTLGTVLSLTHKGHFHLLLFLSMLIASLLIQSATNFFNEYFDYKRGLDSEESVGIGGGIVRDGIKASTIMTLAFSFLIIATVLGVYICMETSWWLALIGIGCMAVGYFYTGGPYPIAYTPFGELFAGGVMGMAIVLISFFVQTGTVTFSSILFSIPIMILVGGILMSNNIRDLEGDKKNGRHTLAIVLGRERAILFLGSMFFVSFIWMVGLLIFIHASLWVLIVFLSSPKAYKAIKIFKENSQPIKMMPAMQATAQVNTLFGLLLSIGLLIRFFIS